MSSEQQPSDMVGYVSLSHLERIDAICLESERAWQSGEEEKIESRMEGFQGPLRQRLLSELLALEIHYRRQRGAQPSREELCQRLPESESVIDAVLGKTAQFVPQFANRYTPIAEIGRGGMGAIWSVVDQQFERPLAVKVMLPHHAQNPEAVARFQREAQLTGALQHPAIPPVVDHGNLRNGSPYFSMKLIEGKTLREMLESQGEEPTSDSELPRLLGIFEQVCQAVGYAHSLGYVHRDLKPANIMVGEFGEVQVMDWGMAKRLGESVNEPTVGAPLNALALNDGTRGDLAAQETADLGLSPQDAEAREATLPDNSFFLSTQQTTSIHTRDGAVMGTLAYMPPEQARGEVASLNHRWDVFSLGAILCKILTGSAPYTGSATEVLYKAKQGELGEAMLRLDNCGADAELVEVTKACLSVNPDNRPTDAAALAGRITDYLADIQERLKQAELRRVAAEVRAEGERRARRLSIGATVLLIALLVVGGSVVFWRVQEQYAEELKNAAISEEFDAYMEEFRTNAAGQRWAEAETALARADSLLASYPTDAMQREVKQGEADLAMARRLDAIRLELSEIRLEKVDRERIDAVYIAAFNDYGLDLDPERLEESARHIAQSNIRGTLQGALEYWGLFRASAAEDDDDPKHHVLQLARLATNDPLRHRLLDALLNLDREELLKLAGEDISEQSVAPLILLGEGLAMLGEPDAAKKLLDTLQQRSLQKQSNSTISRSPSIRITQKRELIAAWPRACCFSAGRSKPRSVEETAS